VCKLKVVRTPAKMMVLCSTCEGDRRSCSRCQESLMISANKVDHRHRHNLLRVLVLRQIGSQVGKRVEGRPPDCTISGGRMSFCAPSYLQ